MKLCLGTDMVGSGLPHVLQVPQAQGEKYNTQAPMAKSLVQPAGWAPVPMPHQ